jgi:hypothetical protein
MSALAKTATVSRLVIDAGIFITAITVAFILNRHHHDEKSHTPVVFEVYDLRAYDKVDSLHEYFGTSVAGKPLCATGAGCPAGNIAEAAFLAALRTQTGCTPAAGVVLAPMCAACVDVYAEKIWDEGNALTDKTFDAAVKEDAKALKKLRRELESCVARTGGAHTVYAGQSINPWALLAFWCGLAFTYSVAKVSVTAFAADRGNTGIALLVFAMVGVATVMFAVLSANTSGIAWYFGAGQVLIMCAVPYLVYINGTSDAHPAIFGVYMIAAAPCISSIVFAFHGWLEHDMVNFGASAVTLFFAVALLGDVCSVLWSKAPESRNAKHTHMHVFAVFLLIATVFLFCTAQLPAAPPTTKLSGTLLFALLGSFLALYTIAPSILFQMREANPSEATMYKELAECTLRVLVFAVMMYYANHGVQR